MRSRVPGVPGITAIPEVTKAAGNVVQALILSIPSIPGIRAVLILAKSESRLLVAYIAWHYYRDTGRETSANNIHYQHTLRDFYTE